MNESMNGIDGGMLVENLKEMFSVTLNVFDIKFEASHMIIYTLGFMILSIIFVARVYSKFYKRR